MRRPACLVLPGAGTRLGVVAGAVEILAAHFDFEAYAGTSGGGLVALALASDMTPKEVSALCSKVLARKDLLDVGIPLVESGPCLFRGKKIRELLKQIFGDKKMGDLKYPCRLGASSMWTEKVGLIDSVRHKDILCRDAGYATMAIEGAFDHARLRHDNARTYGDGGAGLNVPAGAWDDRMARTVVVRFKEQQMVHSLENLLRAMDGDADYEVAKACRTPAETVMASFNIMMGAASAAFPSRKKDTVECVLESTGDGLKFGLEPSEIAKLRTEGATSAARFIASRIGV